MEAVEESKGTFPYGNHYSASSEDSDISKETAPQRNKVYKHKAPLPCEGRPRSSSDDSVLNTYNTHQPPSQNATQEIMPLVHPNFRVAGFAKNMSGNEETPIEMTPNADLVRENEELKKKNEEKARIIQDLEDEKKQLQQRIKELSKRPRRNFMGFRRGRNQQSTQDQHPAPF